MATNYGKRVRSIRVSKGIKACFAAYQLGLSRTWYCLLEKGEQGQFSVAQLEKLTAILGCTMQDILCPKVSEMLSKTGTGV